MSPGQRLTLFFLAAAALVFAALWGTRETLWQEESLQEIGLRWLKEEYHLDDATFERVSALHREYFVQCSQMCRKLGEADRPLLWRNRQRNRQSVAFEARLSKEQALCAECEKKATEHLRQVAEMMPPGQGERFLNDSLPALEQQRREHDRRISSNIRR
jgi:hypothetical protein